MQSATSTKIELSKAEESETETEVFSDSEASEEEGSSAKRARLSEAISISQLPTNLTTGNKGANKKKHKYDFQYILGNLTFDPEIGLTSALPTADPEGNKYRLSQVSQLLTNRIRTRNIGQVVEPKLECGIHGLISIRLEIKPGADFNTTIDVLIKRTPTKRRDTNEDYNYAFYAQNFNWEQCTTLKCTIRTTEGKRKNSIKTIVPLVIEAKDDPRKVTKNLQRDIAGVEDLKNVTVVYRSKYKDKKTNVESPRVLITFEDPNSGAKDSQAFKNFLFHLHTIRHPDQKDQLNTITQEMDSIGNPNSPIAQKLYNPSPITVINFQETLEVPATQNVENNDCLTPQVTPLPSSNSQPTVTATTVEENAASALVNLLGSTRSDLQAHSYFSNKTTNQGSISSGQTKSYTPTLTTRKE